MGSEDVSLAGTPTGNFDTSDVGTAKTVTITGFSLTGADSGNYFLAAITTTADITARAITATADLQTKAYGDADPALTFQVTSGSLVGADSFSGSLSRVTGETVGSYAIQQGSLALSGNYDLSFTGDNLTITQAATTTTLSSSANPSVFAQTVTFTATVGAAPGTPTGNVIFTVDGAPVSTATLNGSGQATYAGAFTTLGTHTLSAAYQGDSRYSTSAQNLNQAVSLAPAITSGDTTAFTVGQAGSFTVTTFGYPTAGLSKSGSLPTGVTFVDNSDGTATLAGTPAAGTAGTFSLTITAGNGTSPDATQSFTLTVNAAPALVGPAFTSGDTTAFTVG